MKVAVATKMSNRELAKKNSSSGPRSRASLRNGLSFCGSVVMATLSWTAWCSAARPRTQSGIQPDDGAGEIVGREWRQILDALADADEVHRHGEFLGDGDENAAAGGAVELGHDQAGDADRFAENVHLGERVLPDS